jgi:WD40 repeat protein
MTSKITSHKLEHGGSTLRVYFSFDGQYIAVHSREQWSTYNSARQLLDQSVNTIIVWQTQTKKEGLRLQSRRFGPVTFSTVDHSLLVGQNGLCLWNVATGNRINSLLDIQYNGTEAAAFSPDGTQLAIAIDENEVIIADNTGQEIYSTLVKEEDDREIVLLRFLPEGNQLAGFGYVYDSLDRLYLWDIPTQTLTTFGNGDWGEDDVFGRWLYLSRHGRFLTAPSEGWTFLELWERRALESSYQWHPLTLEDVMWDRVGDYTISPDEHTLVLVGMEQKDEAGEIFASFIQLCDILTGKEQWRIPLVGKCYCMVISPDSQILVTMSGEPSAFWREDVSEYQMTFWDMTSGEKINSFSSGQKKMEAYNSPRSVDFSPEGKWLSVTYSGFVELWDFSTMLS